MLSATQLQILKTDVLAAADPIPASVTPLGFGAFVGQPINAATFNGQPTLHNPDWNACLAAVYALAVNPDFFVYVTGIPVQAVFNGITWANFTPVDPPTDPTPGNDTAVTLQRWSNRSLACQGKQFNVQLLLGGGQQTINAALVNVRAGLQDALTNIPAGVGGALILAGWVNIRDTILARKATRVEKLFATVGGQQDGSTAAKAATMVIEGLISGTDIETARSS